MNDPKTFLEPLGGYLADAFAKLGGRPFVPHSLTKLHNLKVCRDLAGAKTVIEIGSFKGVTTRRLSYLFDQVVSIEIDEVLFKVAKKRCENRKNVQIHLGDGTVLLPKIICEVQDAVLFLDGHFSGGDTGQGDEPEPVLKEVDLLQNFLGNVAAVVIDDYRLFGVDRGWPKKSEVMAKLESIFPETEWIIQIQYDQFLVFRKIGRK